MATMEEPAEKKYNFTEIESRWQERWKDSGLYCAPEKADAANKFYMLVMFAYPSGDIHMGHFRNYIIGDAVARHQMMLGKSVMHPFGWDAFGLPAERAAIQRDIHPEEWTMKNIEMSRSTLQKVGISFDWSREVVSCLPNYYRWTQWLFTKLFEKKLAYRKRGLVNWCPVDLTVLANEQVVDGKCERCGSEVEKKEQVQWYFRITAFADRLIDDLDKLPDWPENRKAIQREWIGRSYGIEVDFVIEDSGEKLPIFTTRPDTIYGVTFMAISPESDILKKLTLDEPHASEVAAYIKKAAGKSDIERAAQSADKDGVFTGKFAINPFDGEPVQLWVADYVLAGYGTGAVMAVPAHDERDFAFARKYDIPIKVVIQTSKGEISEGDDITEANTEYGKMVNSDEFDGLSGEKAIGAVCDYAEAKKIGKRKVNYRLNDWLISRQRYWGCPIPIVHCDKCGEVAVPENELPVKLPHVDDYKPKGRSPLADVADFVKTTCPNCGGEAKRDVDTMDTFVCSAWYFLRFLDPHNESAPFDSEKANSWMPIDLYIGGISHATGHLIYFRFLTKFLHDLKLLDCDEPARAVFNHGMVFDDQGEMMSKSKGNVVSPLNLMAERGIDVTRLAMFCTAPSEKEINWSEAAVTGVEKFVTSRLFPIIDGYRDSNPDLKRYFKDGELADYDRKAYVALNQTIKKVSESIERLQFNTAISALMVLAKEFDSDKIKSDALNDIVILKTIQLAAPMAPHLAEELWAKAGNSESIFKSSWPQYDPEAVVGDMIQIAVQVNGKLRDTISIEADSDQEAVEAAALASDRIKSHTDGKTIVKKIYIKGRLLNLVVKG